MIIRKKITDRITDNFLKYLECFPISTKTLKNYKSDISHFTAWIIFKIRSYGVLANSLTDTIPFIKHEMASEYKEFMVENKEQIKTINRRLSTLRHLARFLLESQILSFDFMYQINNINITKNIKLSQHPVIFEFEKHLQNQKVSKNTVKNYVSDVRQFLVWLEANRQSLITEH